MRDLQIPPNDMRTRRLDCHVGICAMNNLSTICSLYLHRYRHVLCSHSLSFRKVPLGDLLFDGYPDPSSNEQSSYVKAIYSQIKRRGSGEVRTRDLLRVKQT